MQSINIKMCSLNTIRNIFLNRRELDLQPTSEQHLKKQMAVQFAQGHLSARNA